MGFFDIGPEMLILIFVIIILLFGATKIPELAKGLGRAMGEFKRGKMEVEREMKTEEMKWEQEKQGETPVIRAAKELGIDVKDKKEADLRKEIEKKLAEKPEEKLSPTAKAAKELGIDVKGKSDDALKKEISRKMST